MITYEYLNYFPWVTLFLVGEYMIMHVSSLHMTYRGMDMIEKKYVVTSYLIFAIIISSSNCHTNKYFFSAK